MSHATSSLWCERTSRQKDELVPRVKSSAAVKAIKCGKPIVIQQGALGEWYDPKRWTLEALAHRLKDHEVKNVFRSSTNRFKYYRDDGGPHTSESKLKDTRTTDGERITMRFGEFLQRATAASDGAAGSREHLYLYGEPLPTSVREELPMEKLMSFINIREKASKETNEEKGSKPFLRPTSMLLWVAADNSSPSISPLHYDLSDGIILQLKGEKRFILIEERGHEEAIYPHAISGNFDRQSKIDDIQKPGKEFDMFQGVKAFQCVLNAGEALYIPFGCWHQVESPSESVAITIRWNPYADTIRSSTSFRCLALQQKGSAAPTPPPSLPPNVAEMLYRKMIRDLPKHVANILIQRFDAEKEELQRK
eukprot:jgi/Bigna1/127161/aug1.4_g1869